ncbi:pentatricopeptide repeat-containing protein [Tanacetum coccineum]
MERRKHQLGSNVRVVNGLIDMYSKCGELDKGRSLFDNVARGGLFEEAMDMINNMEVNQDGAVWGSLLGAHTLLSNLNAANGKRDDVARIRTSLDNVIS